MHPLAQRAYAAFFGPLVPDPADFLALAQEVAILTPEGDAAMWGDARELATGQVVTTADRAVYATTAGERLATVRRIVTLLRWAPAWVQRRAIDLLRTEAREILPPDAPPVPETPRGTAPVGRSSTRRP